jgi:hypothetical protein
MAMSKNEADKKAPKINRSSLLMLLLMTAKTKNAMIAPSNTAAITKYIFFNTGSLSP